MQGSGFQDATGLVYGITDGNDPFEARQSKQASDGGMYMTKREFTIFAQGFQNGDNGTEPAAVHEMDLGEIQHDPVMTLLDLVDDAGLEDRGNGGIDRFRKRLKNQYSINQLDVKLHAPSSK